MSFGSLLGRTTVVRTAGVLLALVGAVSSCTAETLSHTIVTGSDPSGVAVNSSTNRIYVPGTTRTDGRRVLAVVSGADNTVSTVELGVNSLHSAFPGGNGPRIAVNPVTNRIYMPGDAGSDVPDGRRVLAVIDGATHAVNHEPHRHRCGRHRREPGYGSHLHRGHSCFRWSACLTVVNGGDSSSVFMPLAMEASWIAVNPSTNRIYFGGCNLVDDERVLAVMDGSDYSTTMIAIGGIDAHGLVVDPRHRDACRRRTVAVARHIRRWHRLSLR